MNLPEHRRTCPRRAGLLIGIISPLQRLFYSSRVGDQDVAPLSFVAASLNILGGAAIPSTMLVRPQLHGSQNPSPDPDPKLKHHFPNLVPGP